jgi:beta-glucosidase
MEGEEMDIVIDGFKAGDRTKIDLPRPQQDLIKAVNALGKPVVVVLLNGSALAVNWEQNNVAAILEAWYPGQAAGHAIADVLAGDYNPGGRLPVTFYKSVTDLPSFNEYNLSGQTYRYFKGEPLYPFGYGLSYTTFAYENLKIENQHKAGDSVRLSVDVKNTGTVGGDEVVQVYISCLSAPVKVPLRSLAEFKRIHLAPNESKKVVLVISPNAFSLVNENGERINQPGQFEISVGGGQPDVKVGKIMQQVLKTKIDLR